MKRSQSGLSPRRARLVKVLSIMAVFTLLGSVLLGILSSMTGKYTTVLDTEEIALIQLDPPKSGSKTAVMHTTAGDLTFTLYPEECPETVANFCALAESGYYNNTYVFRVEPGVFFSAGAKTADGKLPEGTAGTAQEHVPRELSAKLWPLRGALCALTTETEGGVWARVTKTEDYFTGSRFLVCNSIEMTQEIRQGLQTDTDEAMKPVADAYLEHGGIPNYSQQITVFGQLTDGFDILDAVTSAELTGEAGAQRPEKDILIESVEISEVP